MFSGKSCKFSLETTRPCRHVGVQSVCYVVRTFTKRVAPRATFLGGRGLRKILHACQRELPAELRMHVLTTQSTMSNVCTVRQHCSNNNKPGVLRSGHFAETATALRVSRAVHILGQAPTLTAGHEASSNKKLSSIYLRSEHSQFQRPQLQRNAGFAWKTRYHVLDVKEKRGKPHQAHQSDLPTTVNRAVHANDTTQLVDAFRNFWSIRLRET